MKIADRVNIYRKMEIAAYADIPVEITSPIYHIFYARKKTCLQFFHGDNNFELYANVFENYNDIIKKFLAI